MTPKRWLYLIVFALLGLIAPLAYQIDRAAQSLPRLDGELRLTGLSAAATVETDATGIPTVTANNRADAYRVLGFLHARDRLFQMDLMRRKAVGRLAEIFGEKALPVDRQQRIYRFEAVAAHVIGRLPETEKQALFAYVDGVNAQLAGAREVPPEFRLLGYRPEPWRAEDSLLVAFGMFQTLTADQQDDERMLTVMSAILPPEVTAFLTPDTDDYTETLVGGKESHRPARAIPKAALAALVAESGAESAAKLAALVESEPASIGSNNWAAGAARTADGRAIVADDMHLPLAIPNVWYRARLRYAEVDITGVGLPGLPLTVVGSNGHVAWGFTNVDGDMLDLVRLEVDPADRDRYRAPEGWRKFDVRKETIRVKDGLPVDVETLGTVWGPVLAEPLLGDAVALRWTALDPAAVNLKLMEMDGVRTVDAAMAVLNRSGAPPQNVVLADERGSIGWTYMGFFPNRRGFDGSVAIRWSDGYAGWDGFIPPERLPRLTDPPEGFVATANNRTLGKDYPYVIGHSFSNGYRAHRIRQNLAAGTNLTERSLLALQLDTVSEFYEFYRKLALWTLDQANPGDPELADARAAITGWNGRLDPDSKGIGFLVQWRKALARAVFAPIVRRGRALDGSFTYRWKQQETPLRALLSERLPETLPDRRRGDWPGFLLAVLRETLGELKRDFPGQTLKELRWGEIERITIRHPFSASIPAAGWLLDMPAVEGGCNSFCLKVLHGAHGASERMVISPNHPEDGLLQMPGGQSGHPLSPFYGDQQRAWAEGAPSPFLPGPAQHRLSLSP